MKKLSISLLSLAIIIALTTGISLALSPEKPKITTQTKRSPEERRTIELYKRSKDAVVFISTVTINMDPFDHFSSMTPQAGSGTGIIIDAKQGFIVTNLHVIANARQIEILLSDGQPRSAKVLGYDFDFDLAVLQLIDPPKNLVEIPFGDSANLEVGQKVYAIGNPFGLSQTLTSGIISSLDRAVRNSNGKIMRGLVQTDAAINPGNSGGPLLDAAGNLIGVNTAILSQSGDSAGIGFAVPSNQVFKVLPELIATGKISRPRVGWVLIDTELGPMVRRVIPGSPADGADIIPIERAIKRGPIQMWVRDFENADLIVAVNGKEVRSIDDIDQIILDAQPNKPAEFTVKKGNSRETRLVKITPVIQ